ncbi:MAG: PEP-CTERM sorting domain-containing protein [Phycisphaerales bacterium]
MRKNNGWMGMGLAAIGLFAVSAQAATITYLGGDAATGPDWNTASVAKPAAFDPNADNKYGSDGYNLSYRTGTTDNATLRYVISLPAYIASVTHVVGVGTWGSSSSGYPLVDDPTGADANTGLRLRSNTANLEQDYLVITLAQNADFVMGVTSTQGRWVDVFSTGRLRQTVGGSADTGLVDLVSTPVDPVTNPSSKALYDFFRINGSAGDVLIFSAKHDFSGFQAGTFGVTFEAIPEPASLGLMALGGLMMVRGRGR